MDLYLALYVGVFIKWVVSGFKNKFRNELYGENEYTHYIKKVLLTQKILF